MISEVHWKDPGNFLGSLCKAKDNCFHVQFGFGAVIKPDKSYFYGIGFTF